MERHPCYWIDRLSNVKMAILPKAMYRRNVQIQCIEIPMISFEEMENPS